MENATKALLIAAAVLVTILVISLGLVIYNKASEAVNNANMDQSQIQAFNEKFDSFQGTKRGSEVKSMYKTVFNHNLEQISSGENQTVTISGISSLDAKATTCNTSSISSSKMYEITVNHDTKTGLVNTITVAEKNDDTTPPTTTPTTPTTTT